MGEIVIKIPSKKNRQYVITDPDGADKIIDVLERSAVRVKKNSNDLSPEQIQDLRDIEAAHRNLEEMKRTGVSYSVEELREEFGIV